MAEVENCEQLSTRIDAAKQQTDNADERRYLVKRAIELGCVEKIPDEWGIEVEGNG